MAKNNQQPAAANAANPVNKPNGPPAGFNDEGRPDIDGWLKASEGLVVHGRLCGFFSFVQRNRDGTNKVREVLCVRLLQPIAASREGGEMVQLEKGQVLAASMMYALEPLKAYIANRGEIWVRFTQKIQIGAQSVWKAEVYGKGAKAPPPISTFQAPAPSNSSDADEESWA